MSDKNMSSHFSLVIFISFMSKFAQADANWEECDIRNEALFVNDPEPLNEKEIPLCPAESKDDKADMEEWSNPQSELKYCLFKETVSKKNSRLCNREPKPVMYIVKDEDNKPVRCGFKKDHFLHNFGYFYCQKMSEDKLRDMDRSNLNIINDILVSYIVTYTVCYDISKSETIWTRHQVLSIFKDPYFIEESYCLKEISTEPFYKNSKQHFQTLQNDFYAEKKDETIVFKMAPQRLVPDKHFALRTWKKTTNHYINIAPLWKYLILLMAVIDEGLYRAAINVYLTAFRSKTPHIGLIFYTRTKSALSFTDKLFKWFSEPDRFEYNIWYKFVYDPMTEQGVMIHVRNTPATHVDKKVRKTNFCDFKNWTKHEKVRELISLHLLEQYAYCSHVTSREIRKLFNIDLKIRKKVLDIDFLSRI